VGSAGDDRHEPTDAGDRLWADTPWALSGEELQALPGYGKDHEANLLEAKRLLAEVGYLNGFQTVLTNRNYKPPPGHHQNRRLEDMWLAEKCAVWCIQNLCPIPPFPLGAYKGRFFMRSQAFPSPSPPAGARETQEATPSCRAKTYSRKPSGRGGIEYQTPT
jgi:hypothetical protein